MTTYTFPILSSFLAGWTRALPIVLVGMVLFAMPAQAARWPAIINLGDELFEVAPLPATLIPSGSGSSSIRVGYKCQHVGLFWADIWTWNCQLVQVVSDDEYGHLPDAVAAQLGNDPQFTMRHAQRSFWNHYAFWAPFAAAGVLSGLVVMLAVVIALKRALLSRQ